LAIVHNRSLSIRKHNPAQTIRANFPPTLCQLHIISPSSANMRKSDTDLGIAIPSDRRVSDEFRTPTLISPPESKTPPTASHKRHHSANATAGKSKESEPIDPSALSKALEQFEQAGRQREHTPGASPSRKRQRIYGDRSVRDWTVLR